MPKFTSLIKNVGRATALSFKFFPYLTFFVFLIMIVTSVTPIFQAKILGDIVNKLVESVSLNIPIASLLVFVFIYAGIWGVNRILGALELYLLKIWRDKAHQEFDLMIFKKRTEIDLGHHESPKFQDLMLRAFSRGSSGPLIEIVQNQFFIFSQISIVLLSSLITASISWNIYLIIITTSIPSFVVQIKYGHKVWGIFEEHSDRRKIYGAMRQQLQGRIGITQIKLLQNSSKILEIVRDALESFTSDNNKLDRQRFTYQAIAAIISASGFGFSLWLITKDVINGSLSIGTLVFIISALGSLVGALNILLARLASQIEQNLYLNDIFDFFDTKPFIERAVNPIKLNLTKPPVIEFKNVSFKYEGREDWILKDVNLVINPGEKVALVGMNGAGKSTLVKLISRIYDPTEGEILINGINLRKLDIEEWSSYLSVLLQDYTTYDLKVKESIAMGRISEELDLSRVENAAKDSGASEFITEWEHSYDQRLGKEFDGGIEPSKGQNQKIALARAIYRNGLVMILDEPTAAIDALSETKIFEAMEKAVHGNTLIVITHRFNTTQSLDKIIVLDKGTVVEIGTHKELISHKGLYHEMFESQAKAFRSEVLE